MSAPAGAAAARDFGPDTTQTGINTGQVVVTPGLHCEPPGGPPSVPLLCSGYLASGLDGTMLDVSVWLPRTGSSFPLVVGIHGWGGSKLSMRGYAQSITDRGLALMAYSARGFGESYGQTNLADVNVEGVDLRSMIGQVVDERRLRIDPSAVAVFGASYGGAHAWMAAMHPRFNSPRGRAIVIRMVAPLATWSELTAALHPNGRTVDPIEPAGGFKLSFTEGLYVGGCKDVPVCSNYPTYLQAWNAWMATTEPNNTMPVDRQIVDAFSGYRSIYWQNDFWTAAARERIPIFLAQGWTDDLFPAGEALRMYNGLKTAHPDYPIALYLGDIGHPRAPNEPAEVDFVIDQLLSWLVWYLKGEGMQPPLDVQAAITRQKGTEFDPADVIRVATYDSLVTSIVTHTFSTAPQVITYNPANTTGVMWDPLIMLGSEELAYWPGELPSDEIPGNVAAYEVAASELGSGEGFLVAGEPSVTLTLQQMSPTGYRVQLNVRLFAITVAGEKHLITRGTYTLDSGNPLQPIGTMSLTIPTYGNLWQLHATDTLRVEITNVDSPYIAPSKVPSATEIRDVTLTIPAR